MGCRGKPAGGPPENWKGASDADEHHHHAAGGHAMIVHSWGKVRSLMRSRRMTEVIHEERGVSVQTVRRDGMPQTLRVPHAAGPMPANLRDVEREFGQHVSHDAGATPVDVAALFKPDDSIDGLFGGGDDTDDE